MKFRIPLIAVLLAAIMTASIVVEIVTAPRPESGYIEEIHVAGGNYWTGGCLFEFNRWYRKLTTASGFNLA